ncbi:MAG: hypothetical protein RIQ97_2355 [Pseudomonadota bacterium]|jgi:tetratricopeptide (TPR) repeat protein
MIRMSRQRALSTVNKAQARTVDDPAVDIAKLMQQALGHHQRSEWALAKALYERILSIDRAHPHALHMLGVMAHQLKRHPLALDLIDRALALRPDLVAAHANRGVVLHALGRLQDALASYARALELQPQYPDAHMNMGNALRALDRHEEALACYDRALQLQSGHAQAWFNRGNALQSLARPAEALASFDRALSLRPDDPAMHSNRGNVLQELNRMDEALQAYDRAIALQPDHPEAHFNRGSVLQGMERFDEALRAYDQALAIQPRHALAWSNRGTLLETIGRTQEAIASFSRALELAPTRPSLHYNLGNALRALDRNLDAVTCYDQALALDPGHVGAWVNRGISLLKLNSIEASFACYENAEKIDPLHAQTYANRGNVYLKLGQINQAIEQYDRAIAIEPGQQEFLLNKALSLLLLGDFKRGWPLYEWRWKSKTGSARQRSFDQPLWLGQADLAGKTILLHAEQGLGDVIQFCRYAGLVKALGARVLLEVPASLKGLLEGLAGVDELLVAGAALPRFDVHCPLMSLPLAFRTEQASIPSPGAYLKADAVRQAQWRERLGPRRQARIGLVWSGNPNHQNDRHRSLALAEVLPHLPSNAQWVSLQHEVRPADQEALKASSVLNVAQDLRDFADTAALVANLDLVVSVDTSVAHLSAALGVPTWVLLPRSPDFRWLLDRPDSPWYAAMTLYRQHAFADWSLALERLAHDLRQACASGSFVRPQAPS